MDRFALIGTGIAHSQSPRLFAEAYGGRYAYDLIDRQDFASAWEQFLIGPYRAINITAPFKADAAAACVQSPEVQAIGAANIAVKTADGIVAYNSDYRGVLSLVRSLPDIRTAVIVGFGGAGKAAYHACLDAGLDVSVRRHAELAPSSCALSFPVEADLIVYTLPSEVPGARNMKCRYLLEANYKDPVFASNPLPGTQYIPGTEWLLAQARTGYELMTGEKPNL